MEWNRKDLLGLEDLTKEEIKLILDTTESFKEISTREIKKVPALRGKTIANLFFEPSTRTRISFELAEKRLSADVVNFSASTSSLSKGETFIDTAKNIEAMKIDCVVIRHSSSGASYMLSKKLNASVINAGDGTHEHPTQALLDMFTIREKKGGLEGLKVAIVGDIRHSRVARSNIWGMRKMGIEVRICGPKTLLPVDIEKTGAKVFYHIEHAIKHVDVIMALRIQKERQGQSYFPSIREYSKFYGLTSERLKYAKGDVLIMHPGPINRGVEIMPEVADGPYSVILEQVTNGLAVRMAVLYLVMGSKTKEVSA
ncbi:MAG: aspartate carbamoyltransferase catalytic subunit [bacterium]|nr:aspartate carbamoyltransferase catalytic subunit [bacterium]